MTIVRITIRKNLTQGRSSYRHSASSPFATEYVVHSSAAFPNHQIKEYARNIVLVESRLYPACVHFEDAFIKLATPGASAQELRGQFCYADTDDLTGQLDMPEGKHLAYPPISAVFNRETIGRQGRLVLPYALTTSEWTLYSRKDIMPMRYQRPNNLAPCPVCDHLLEAAKQVRTISAQNSTYTDGN